MNETRNINVLFVIEGLGAGGKERQLVELIQYLSARPGFSIHLILFKDVIHYKNLEKMDLNIEIISRKKGQVGLSMPLKILRFIKKHEIDVINPWGNMAAFYSNFSKLLSKTKLVNFQIQDAPAKMSWKLSLMSKVNFFFSDIIVANSKAGLLSYGLNTSPKTKVIYNGFIQSRVKNLNSANLRKALGCKPGDLIIGMVASYSNAKDHNTFINAAKILIKEFDHLIFICFGAGNKDQYSSLINEDIMSKIILEGPKHPVEPFIQEMDICVLATFTEGISNSVMEYMSLGKPVVVTKGGGTPELVEDSSSGFLVEERNADDLVDKIRVLILNEQLRMEMGKRGEQIIKTNFDISTMGKNFETIFNTI